MKKIVVFLVAIYLVSCSSSHKIHINSDNSATVNFSVNNKESLIDTLLEWGAIQNTKEIIDTEQISSEFDADENISNFTIESPNENSYNGNFKINNVDNLFNPDGIPNELQIFSITESENEKTLKIKLSLNNYLYLKESLPILQEESIDMLGPDANQDVTQEEYLDMMSFSLGDNGPKDILDSSIELEISVDGSILNIEGGEQVSDNKAIFNVQLIDIILLNKELIYSLTYK